MSKSILSLEPYSVFANMPSIEPDWIWRDIFAEGSCSLLSGKPKAGKSTLIRHLIKSLILGESFLDKETEKCQVIYLAFEEQKEYLKKIFTEVGLESTDGLQIHVGPIDPSKKDAFFQELKEACETYQAKLVIVDPFIKALSPFDTNDYSLSTSATQFFLNFAREHKVHVLLIHHSRKGETHGQDSAMGSTGFVGGVDNVLILERSAKFSSLSITGRYVEERRITFARNHGSLRIVDSKEKERFLEADILEALALGNQLTRENIRDKVHCRDEALSQPLNSLIESGQIQAIGKGVKGSKRLYKLNSPIVSETGKE